MPSALPCWAGRVRSLHEPVVNLADHVQLGVVAAMSALSSKLRRWADPSTGDEGLTYYCQGCSSAHSIRTKGNGAWGWNGDVDKPIFTPSVLVTGQDFTEKGEADFEAWLAAERPDRNGVAFESVKTVCHTFVGCNGAQPGEVVFLGDCTHALAGQVLPFPDLPDWMK